MIAEEAGLDLTVWDEKRLEADGFGGLLGVGRASASPPRLIRLDYAPRKAGRRTPTVALVGKGITFDTGGLSIKPGEAMVNMKRDMTGGAVVMATMAALAAVGCPVRVVGLIAAAENSIGGDALRPGDVITPLRRPHQRGHQHRRRGPTGPRRRARVRRRRGASRRRRRRRDPDRCDEGRARPAGRAATSPTTRRSPPTLRAAGEAAGEPLWRFPLTDAYEGKLSSTVADSDNAPSGPGAITAALFLQHFVGDLPWAHLDIASVGDAPDDRFEWTTGPTGFGARALLQWLGSDDPLAGVGAT